MATNLAIDDKLLEEAKVVGKHRTKKAAVTEALQEYIQRHRQVEIIKSTSHSTCIKYEKGHSVNAKYGLK